MVLRQSLLGRLLSKIMVTLMSNHRLLSLSETARRNCGGQPIVVMYHSVTDAGLNDGLTVTPESFRKQLGFFIDNNYTFAFESEYCECNEKSVIITLDDGYSDNYYFVFPLLKKTGATATVNLISEKLRNDENGAYLTHSQLLEMQQSGLVEFQSHTVSHKHLISCTDDLLTTELSDSKDEIRALLHNDCDVIVYPYQQADEQTCRIATQYYRLGYGGIPSRTHPEMTLKRITLPDTADARLISKTIFLQTT